MEFKDSKTFKNLQTAFAGESQARNKYNYYSSKAKKDGYEQIAEIFDETALNEKEHAKLWFKAMHNDDVPNTMANLLDAAAGEHEEWTNMYKEMAKVAQEEGYGKLAYQFSEVAKIEKRHEERYKALYDKVKNGKVFVRDGEIAWKCRNCGHIHFGKTAPEVCPVCNHPKSYFEELGKNY